jgi:hypothetical protein
MLGLEAEPPRDMSMQETMSYPKVFGAHEGVIVDLGPAIFTDNGSEKEGDREGNVKRSCFARNGAGRLAN